MSKSAHEALRKLGGYHMDLRGEMAIKVGDMMTSSNENIFRVTGPLSPVNPLHKGWWRGALMFSLICAWTNRRANNRNAGNLKRHRAHYDVIVMIIVRYTVWLTNHNKTHTVWPVKGHCPLQRRYILMAYCKTTVSLWLTHCRYYSFAPGHRFVDRLVVCARMPAVL